MPSFSNQKDLEKYLRSQMKKGGTSGFVDQAKMRNILNSEAIRFFNILYNEMQKVYDYTPVYPEHRSGQFGESLRMGTVEINGNNLSIPIWFDETTSTHDSIMKSGEPGYVPILLNYGHRWKSNSGHAYRFSFFEGYSFVENAITEFNKNNKYGLIIEIKAEYGGGVIDHREYM
jgi:hypothetical protein